MTIEEKKTALAQVTKEIIQTEGGPLKAPGINPVSGEGNPNAQVMFIGEAPGFDENVQQRPFVGKSGKLLRKCLVEAGFLEDDVYITNIVKYRPPKNRDPLPNEIIFFQPFLDKQIQIIQPKVVVTLGRYSMYKFLGDLVKISQIHGIHRSVIWNGMSLTIFPMFHPAAALRDPLTMKHFLTDFNKLKDFIDTQQNYPATVATSTNIKSVTAEQLSLM